MTKTVFGSFRIWVKNNLTKVLLSCGILSSLLYTGTVVISAASWEQYNSASQTVSELIAINAPTRPVVVPLFISYSFLVYLFGWGIWRASDRKRSLQIAAVLIVSKEILGVAATLFFPIHLRGIDVTFTDTMHAILTVAGTLICMFPAVGFTSMAFGKQFRFYSIATMIIFLTFGVLTGLSGPKLADNLPTPLMGLWERINIFIYLLWIIILTLNLLKKLKRISYEIN